MRYRIIQAMIFVLVCGTFGAAQAQIYKCEDSKGAITFSGQPCAANQDTDRVYPSRTTPPSVNSRQIRRASPKSPYDAELTSLVAAALAQKDYAEAEQLAVTTEQWEMIRNARRQDTDLKLRIQEQKRRRRPTLCLSFGNRQDYGDTQYSQTTTTCR